jgi:peptidoglycan/LPS O-acetylase OafA/YrhL
VKVGTSLYLDLARFLAALVVFLVHLQVHASSRFSPFWRFHLNFMSQTAVTVFFVLSGYVIAHVLATRENTAVDYAASRLARLYSVVVPALILTAVCNYLITLKYPDLYQTIRAQGHLTETLHYVATGLFLSSFWLWPDLQPPNAGPFWSLSFEAAYYFGAGLFVFARGSLRVLGLLVLTMVAGFTVALLAGTWILGFCSYKFSRQRQLPLFSAAVLWPVSMILLLSCFLIEERLQQPFPLLRFPDHRVGAVVASYAAALCFAVNVISFDALSDRATLLLKPVEGLIRWLGSITFALYLFHYPLLSLLAVYSTAIPASLRLLWLVAGTFLIVATVGHFSEKTKFAYKVFFLHAYARARAGLAAQDTVARAAERE